MAHIDWIEEYSVGVELIDEQHRYILELLDELFDAIASTRTDQEIGDIINRLVAHAALHFATEEDYFDQFGYADAEDHKARHRELTARVVDFKARYAAGEKDIASEIVEFLEGWLIGHIMETDKKYMKCFSEHGLQ